MKKQVFCLWAVFCILLPPATSFAQDMDQDGIQDQTEIALATRFAPEWRFNKHRNNAPSGIIAGSNQNITEVNWPSSVDYLVSGAVAQSGELPIIQFYNGIFNPIYQVPFSDINAMPDLKYQGTGPSASNPVFGNGCNGKDLFMLYPDGLMGEPNSFPTYFHCNPLGSDGVAISYFLFSAYDNKHEFLGLGNHNGDWEQFTMVVKNINFATGDIQQAAIDYLLFSQHGKTRFYVTADSPKLRWVNGTHPKIYVSIGSHAMYPEPGALEDYRVDWSPDVYDDVFLGNGLIVQTWLPGRALVNMGEQDVPFPNTQWTRYKGTWGGEDGSYGPVCHWGNSSTSGMLSWEAWITHVSGGHQQAWNGIFMDKCPKFSTNYVPSPGYNCGYVVDCRYQCPLDGESSVQVWGSLKTLVASLSGFQQAQVCLMPCHYPEPLTINKPMVLRAIEGPVVLGAQ